MMRPIRVRDITTNTYPRENIIEKIKIHRIVNPWPTLLVLPAKYLVKHIMRTISTTRAQDV